MTVVSNILNPPTDAPPPDPSPSPSPLPSVDIDLTTFLEPTLKVVHNQTPEQRTTTLLLHAHGLVEWLLVYHFPSKIRKSSYPIVVTSPSRGRIRIQLVTTMATATAPTVRTVPTVPVPTAASTSESTSSSSAPQASFDFDRALWEKSVHAALKKIIVEDLGYMDAGELESSIPENDSEGRGKTDLHNLEKKLSVKVVFDNCGGGAGGGASASADSHTNSPTGHVLLVGDAKKLEKKVFVIRNMLSHYHWRLSGADVAFGKKGSS